MSILEKIIDEKYIGKEENPIKIEDILNIAYSQKINKIKNEVLLIIDPQRDFIDTKKGSLAIEGAVNDINNIIHFIYNNLESLSNIYITLDTHYYDSIFFQSFWKNNNDYVSPFTEVTLEKIENKEIIPVVDKDLQIEYVKQLKKQGSKNLTVWPYHCLYATDGWLIEKQLSNILYFFEAVSGVNTQKIIKGTYKFTEMYGAINPEVISDNNYNIEWVKNIANYDKIYVCGEAKDYCVYTTIRQFCEIYKDNKEITKKIYMMMNCSSSIISEENSLNMYNELVEKYSINLINI